MLDVEYWDAKSLQTVLRFYVELQGFSMTILATCSRPTLSMFFLAICSKTRKFLGTATCSKPTPRPQDCSLQNAQPASPG